MNVSFILPQSFGVKDTGGYAKSNPKDLLECSCFAWDFGCVQ